MKTGDMATLKQNSEWVYSYMIYYFTHPKSSKLTKKTQERKKTDMVTMKKESKWVFCMFVICLFVVL